MAFFHSTDFASAAEPEVPAAPSEKDIGQGNLTCENVGQWGEGKKEKGRNHLNQA